MEGNSVTPSSLCPLLTWLPPAGAIWEQVFLAFWVSFCSHGVLNFNSLVSSSYLLFCLACWCLFVNKMLFFHLNLLVFHSLLGKGIGWNQGGGYSFQSAHFFKLSKTVGNDTKFNFFNVNLVRGFVHLCPGGKAIEVSFQGTVSSLEA